MGDFLSKILAFAESAKQEAADAMVKGADACDAFSAWLRAQAAGLTMAAPDDEAKADECRAALAACRTCKVGADGVGFNPARILQLIQLFEAALSILFPKQG